MQFSKVVGQQHLKQLLIQEINSEKISHAKLFLGKEGYGTLPLVLAYIQYLYCKNRQENDSCGVCDSCLKIQDLQHPDVHFIYPFILGDNDSPKEIYSKWREKILDNPYFTSEEWSKYIDPEKGRTPIIGKDTSTEIIKNLSLTAYEGRHKVMVIWMADELHPITANKLLKSIEEPPNKTLFILIGRQQGNFLQTILSRTQLFRVPKIETDALSVYLRENHGLNISKSDSITLRSEGDLIESVKILSENNEKNDERDLFIDLMRSCYKKDVNEMLDWCDKISNETREYQKNFIQYSLHMFRQSLLKNYTEDVLLRVSNEEAEFLQKFARFITGNNIIDFNNTFNDAYYHLERNASPKIIFTNICFNVMRYIHAA
ncbi:MAG: hypothetical protein M9916_12615 [Crocinitomicaceae bacterium]|nr:hypothetical protein [Crocinitomicaceae bacterium]